MGLSPKELLQVVRGFGRTVENPVQAAIREVSAEPYRTSPQQRFLSESDFFLRVQGYLMFALKTGVVGDEIVTSCYDLAATNTDYPEVQAENERKLARWNEMRGMALAHTRNPRTIEMNLDPAYFSAILSSKKIFEGRA